MDMGTSSTGGTMTTSSAMAAMTSRPSMGMGGGSGCKISMLWNWYTIDACFISRTWRITTPGMFAGSCIGVILLVISLEFLRRVSREYDRYLSHSFLPSPSANPTNDNPSSSPSSSSLPTANNTSNNTSTKNTSSTDENGTKINITGKGQGRLREVFRGNRNGRYKPTLPQQAIRATLHMVQFTIAYFIMLLAMYYNGYIIICIIIGAWLGAFLCSWEGIGPAG
ncbi:hypothetical protein HYFRA_00010679 [Hymenoscyphus fraxineus]|uniref:Copper transport protein n=1 Tax=Hymenoscyphus fraxineus TaxID=746836 RepID=A0A9N9L476_9HELO|nr:hypothetical protein HYFRA_00010679 [Hymenoscyphus fraxineus]